MDKPGTSEELRDLIEEYVEEGNLKAIENIDTSELEIFYFPGKFFNNGIFQNINIGNETLNLSKWDTSNVGGLDYCFHGFTGNIKGLNKWDTSNVRSMENCFSNFKGNFEGVEKWNVENVEFLWNIFNNIEKDKLDLSNWKFKKLSDMNECFGDSTIDELILPNISDNKYKIDAKDMFKNFEGNIIGLDKFDYLKVKSFIGCFSNKELTEKEKKDICKWKIPTNIDTSYMFGDNKEMDWNWFQNNVCLKSKNIHGKFDKKKVINHIKQRLKELENL